MIREKDKSLIKMLLTIFVITGMVLTSELFHEKEIIFPEIAAIAVGSLISPKFAWNTNKIRMIVGIMICAILGVCIVKFLPFPLFFQITIAYLIGRIVLMAMKVTFAPMISAIVLPVLLQSESIVYLVAAFLLTSLIVLMRFYLEKFDFVVKRKYVKETIDFKKIIKQIGISSLFVFVISYISIQSGFKFVIAPPLLVIFTELANPNSSGRKNPIKIIMVITGCAIIGAICRYFLTMTMGYPLFCSALVGCILVLILLKLTHTYIPPTGALMVLAMLIPEASVMTFPIQVCMGCSLMMVFDIFVFKNE